MCLIHLSEDYPQDLCFILWKTLGAFPVQCNPRDSDQCNKIRNKKHNHWKGRHKIMIVCILFQ